VAEKGGKKTEGKRGGSDVPSKGSRVGGDMKNYTLGSPKKKSPATSSMEKPGLGACVGLETGETWFKRSFREFWAPKKKAEKKKSWPWPGTGGKNRPKVHPKG